MMHQIERMVCGVMLLAGLLQTASAQYAGWQHSGSFYILTTSDGANLPASASESDFPLLLRLNRETFNFGQAKANGEDIRFTDSNGASLAYQIEHWDATHGVAGIWVLTPAGDMLLEVQRTSPSLFSNMRIMSTLGIVSGSSGRGLAHFDLEGYAQIAKLMEPLVEQDNYGLVPAKEITAPNLKRACFTTAAKNEIALDFGQPMAWKDECKAWIYLDGVAAPISAGKVSGNVITLQLTSPSTARSISYLSGKHWDGRPDRLLYGANGIAALAFSAVAIEIPTP
jgi:hypothetical protein